MSESDAQSYVRVCQSLKVNKNRISEFFFSFPYATKSTKKQICVEIINISTYVHCVCIRYVKMYKCAVVVFHLPTLIGCKSG